jgi:hypothetical protein
MERLPPIAPRRSDYIAPSDEEQEFYEHHYPEETYSGPTIGQVRSAIESAGASIVRGKAESMITPLALGMAFNPLLGGQTSRVSAINPQLRTQLPPQWKRLVELQMKENEAFRMMKYGKGGSGLLPIDVGSSKPFIPKVKSAGGVVNKLKRYGKRVWKAGAWITLATIAADIALERAGITEDTPIEKIWKDIVHKRPSVSKDAPPLTPGELSVSPGMKFPLPGGWKVNLPLVILDWVESGVDHPTITRWLLEQVPAGNVQKVMRIIGPSVSTRDGSIVFTPSDLEDMIHNAERELGIDLSDAEKTEVYQSLLPWIQVYMSEEDKDKLRELGFPIPETQPAPQPSIVPPPGPVGVIEPPPAPTVVLVPPGVESPPMIPRSPFIDEGPPTYDVPRRTDGSGTTPRQSWEECENIIMRWVGIHGWDSEPIIPRVCRAVWDRMRTDAVGQPAQNVDNSLSSRR